MISCSNQNNAYIKLAKHCIGLDKKKPYVRHGKKFYRPYRNFFAAAGDYEYWEIMKKAGYAQRDKEKNQHGGYTYRLTRSGLDWLGEQLGIHIYDEED